MILSWQRFKNTLYALQSFEYDTKDFLHWTKTHPNLKNIAHKKRLHWTPKIIALAGGWFVLHATCYMLCVFWFGWHWALGYLLLVALTQRWILPYVLVFFLWLIFPFDALAKRWIVARARRKIRKFKNLKVVGITGSYGKTSTKEFAYNLLQGSFRVAKTPENQNTLIGVARTIIRHLTSDTQLLIVEMGAYQPGDIAAICELVRPSIGVITGINEQHRERFGSIEKTLATKTELWRALPTDGVAIFNDDTRFIKELRSRLPSHVRHISYGTTTGAKIQALHVEADENGLKFDVRVYDRPLQWQTKILGPHQALNILAAACLAHVLGVEWEVIRDRVANLEPVPHRFSPIRGAGGVLVIDDTYNSNPDGAKEALKTLATFSNPRKILVTQGLVELGEISDQVHEEIGNLAASVLTTAILVGPLVSGIAKGLRAAGFPENQLYQVKSLDEATALLPKVAKAGDVVLFQNDLPDVYG